MTDLNVFIEINGEKVKAGKLTGTDFRDAVFSYDSNYMSSGDYRPISISLPLQKQAFSAEKTRSFFESLLPEGFSRKAVAAWAKAEEDDYISLLKELGRECIGAIQIAENDQMTGGGYRLLTDNELVSLAREGATKSTEVLMETHLSLAGASGKVGLYYDENNKKWYQPYGIAASTHIVKQSHVRFDHLVLNERLCMITASKLGIEVPDNFIVNLSQKNDEDVLYATKRYDRMTTEKTQVSGTSSDGIISEKTVAAGISNVISEFPLRLHQEDFAQALGIPASEKYETEERHYLKRIFDLIYDYSSNPLEDGLKLWDRIVFNFLIGNTDAHIKNFALIYGADLKSVRLAPAYDIVCTRIYGNKNDLSIMIDGKKDCTEIDRKSLENASKEIHIGTKLAMKRFDYLRDNLEKAINESADELVKSGYKEAGQLGERILKASMI